ncbi:MAG: SUMF1/EgtB/PvdO family nonheme iron enzyme [Polyangiaceae bacterium]
MRPLPWLCGALTACSASAEGPSSPPVPAPPAASSAPVTAPPLAATASASAAPASAPTAQPCPQGMVFVDAVHCPDTETRKVGLRCLSSDSRNPNHLTICDRFAEGQTCSVPERRQRFCIDRYEYPNEKGGHPPVMVNAYDAAGLCAEKGKRLCFESEWTAACEGPDRKPFPYGYERSKAHCNIDNPYVHPKLAQLHHPDDRTRGPELIKLDQSVPSGSLETCKSDFGVYDLTGNFDEWVRTEWRRGQGKWAGLKGGAWGHVRNACRPITTSHVAHWSYYFISFRCCADPDASALPPVEGGPPLWTPPRDEPPPHPAGHPVDRGWTPPPGTVAPHAPKR